MKYTRQQQKWKFLKLYSFRMQLVICAILTISSCSKSASSEGGILILENVNIVDVENGQILPDQYLIIRDSIIEYIGRQSKDKLIKSSVDLEGKYLMPGLWDMHFHASWDRSNDSLLFSLLLSQGITGIRDMGGDLGILSEMKKHAAGNPASCPMVLGSGPIIDGDPPVFYDFTIPLNAGSNITILLDSLVRGGADFIKVYSLLEEELFAQIASYCNKNDISFAGHLSELVDINKSILSGIHSIEHLNRLEELWLRNLESFYPVANVIAEKKIPVCPTLVTYYNKAHMADPGLVIEEYEAFILPALRSEWDMSRLKRIEGKTEEDWKAAAFRLERQKDLVRYLDSIGVPIMAGSDFGGMPFVYPAIGLYQELLLLKEAGLSLASVLSSATIEAARFNGNDRMYGSLKAGKYADILVLDANPLEDLSALSRIRNVYRHGKQIVRKPKK